MFDLPWPVLPSKSVCSQRSVAEIATTPSGASIAAHRPSTVSAHGFASGIGGSGAGGGAVVAHSGMGASLK
jgi:hypothetical protein